MTNEIDEEVPLDPVMEKVRKKMIRLLVISIGIMMLGLMAVLFAIVYKISNRADNNSTDVSNAVSEVSETSVGAIKENILVDVPEGSNILSSTVQGGRMIFDIQMVDGSRQFWIVDLGKGAVVSRITVK